MICDFASNSYSNYFPIPNLWKERVPNYAFDVLFERIKVIIMKATLEDNVDKVAAVTMSPCLQVTQVCHWMIYLQSLWLGPRYLL